jgi:hypothetical protein
VEARNERSGNADIKRGEAMYGDQGFESFDNREFTFSQVTGFIQSSEKIPDILKSELIKHAEFFMETAEERRTGIHPPFAGSVGRTNWVIRNDQLNLVTGLAPGAVGIATYATAGATTANPVVLAVTLLFSALAVGGRLKNKSVSLEETDYHVLMSLKQIGTVSLIALTNFLNGVLIFGRGAWSEEQVLGILQKLKAITVRDGSVEAFVTEASDQRFSANGI